MKIGTGWLQWTEQQTLDTSIDVIADAYEALIEKICLMTGNPIPQKILPATPSAGTPMSANLFMAMFGKK